MRSAEWVTYAIALAASEINELIYTYKYPYVYMFI